jgi:hypothetical protein
MLKKRQHSTTQQSNRIEDDKRQEARRIDHEAAKHTQPTQPPMLHVGKGF